MSEISICIPTYEFKGKGVEYLSDIFDSLRMQSFQDFEVVVSDHSQDDLIYKFCEESSEDLKIVYIQNPNDRGFLAPNTNCAIEHATGKIIKIVYQDDLLVDSEALMKIKIAFEETGCKWLFHGFTHTTDGVETHKDSIPRWCDMMLEGRNLLGNPSCFAFLNESKMYFDTNLQLLIDTELYHRMRMKYGMPHIVSDILTATREHEERTSSTMKYDSFIEHPEGGWLVSKAELEYVETKHKTFCGGGRKYPDEN